jgi:hypothetical protein
MPIGTALRTSRTGWIYLFHTETNKNNDYWYVNIQSASGTTPTGTFSGSFLALKTQ